jgi:hypothetical protein
LSSRDLDFIGNYKKGNRENRLKALTRSPTKSLFYDLQETKRENRIIKYLFSLTSEDLLYACFFKTVNFNLELVYSAMLNFISSWVEYQSYFKTI